MLNQVVVVGRIVNGIKKENGKINANIKIAVPRSYKNDKGEFDTDFFDIRLWNDVAKNELNHCKKGDLIGAKGKLQNDNKNTIILAEKITFLSSKRKDEEGI